MASIVPVYTIMGVEWLGHRASDTLAQFILYLPGLGHISCSLVCLRGALFVEPRSIFNTRLRSWHSSAAFETDFAQMLLSDIMKRVNRKDGRYEKARHRVLERIAEVKSQETAE